MTSMETLRARPAWLDRKAGLVGTRLGKAYCERTGAMRFHAAPVAVRFAIMKLSAARLG